jgi:hypothetical protein
MREFDQEFRHWLRERIERMRRREANADDECLHLRLDDPGVQRRIANLISDIAEKPKRERTPHRA